MIDDYDFNMLRMRFKELQDEVYALRRALDALRVIVEQLERTCQDH